MKGKKKKKHSVLSAHRAAPRPPGPPDWEVDSSRPLKPPPLEGAAGLPTPVPGPQALPN